MQLFPWLEGTGNLPVRSECTFPAWVSHTVAQQRLVASTVGSSCGNASDRCECLGLRDLQKRRGIMFFSAIRIFSVLSLVALGSGNSHGWVRFDRGFGQAGMLGMNFFSRAVSRVLRAGENRVACP